MDDGVKTTKTMLVVIKGAFVAFGDTDVDVVVDMAVVVGGGDGVDVAGVAADDCGCDEEAWMLGEVKVVDHKMKMKYQW